MNGVDVRCARGYSFLTTVHALGQILLAAKPSVWSGGDESIGSEVPDAIERVWWALIQVNVDPVQDG